MMLMQFGQLLVHDITKSSLLPTDKCPGCTQNPGVCFPIRVESFDPRFGCQQPPCCLSFTRASPVCGSNPRSFLNENTAFIDASAIYGSSVPDNNRLRDGASGFLRTSVFNNLVVPPFNQQTCLGAGNCPASFDAGDNRVTLFVGLSALSTIFLREHNRLAQQLQQRNPQWNGDRVFQVYFSCLLHAQTIHNSFSQEARKIVGAEMQAIAVKEWVPKITGTGLGSYSGFNPSVNPSIAAEFTFGAMRFGHGMLQESTNRLTANGQSFSARFEDDILKPNKILFEGGVDPILKGMLGMPIKKPQRLTNAITEKMFGKCWPIYLLSKLKKKVGRLYICKLYRKFGSRSHQFAER